MKKNIGNKIKDFRIANSMTQYDLATALCVSPITVSRYETGQREPNISMIEKLSDVLNVPVSAFFLSDEDYKKIGNTTDLDSKDIQLVNNFNLLNEFGKAEALKRISELVLLSKYTDGKELTKDDVLKDEFSEVLKYF